MVERVLGAALMRFVGLVLAATALGAVIWPHHPNLVYDQPLVVTGLVVTLLLGVATGVWVRDRLPRGRITAAVVWVVAVLVSVGGAWGAGLLANRLAYLYGWDASILSGISESLSRSGVLSDGAAGYFSRYPNTVPIVAIMNTCRDIALGQGTDMYTVYRWFNALCLALTTLLVFVLVRMLRGMWAGLAAQLAVLLLVGCSPWMAVPYSDLPAMPLIVAGLVLVVAALRTRRWWLCVVELTGGGALLGVAYVVKATPAALAAGVGMALLVGLLRRARWRAVVGLAVGTLLAGAAFAGATAAATAVAFDVSRVPQERLDRERVPPPTWWMALGLISAQRPVGGIVYGGFNNAMVAESRNLRGEELRRWSDARLEAELDRLGPWGVVGYEANKQVFNWGDGMFYAWGEGSDAEPTRLYDVSPAARSVQAWNHAEGRDYTTRASLTNGVWLALVLWAGLGLLLSRYRRVVLVMGFGLLGIVAFTLLFQGRSRYLFAYVPVVVALASAVDVPAEARRHVRRLRGALRRRHPGAEGSAGTGADATVATGAGVSALRGA